MAQRGKERGNGRPHADSLKDRVVTLWGRDKTQQTISAKTPQSFFFDTDAGRHCLRSVAELPVRNMSEVRTTNKL